MYHCTYKMARSTLMILKHLMAPPMARTAASALVPSTSSFTTGGICNNTWRQGAVTRASTRASALGLTRLVFHVANALSKQMSRNFSTLVRWVVARGCTISVMRANRKAMRFCVYRLRNVLTKLQADAPAKPTKRSAGECAREREEADDATNFLT